MGLLLLESFGTMDTEIIEAIAKEHKVDVKVVAEHYKEMLAKIKNETKK